MLKHIGDAQPQTKLIPKSGYKVSAGIGPLSPDVSLWKRSIDSLNAMSYVPGLLRDPRMSLQLNLDSGLKDDYCVEYETFMPNSTYSVGCRSSYFLHGGMERISPLPYDYGPYHTTYKKEVSKLNGTTPEGVIPNGKEYLTESDAEVLTVDALAGYKIEFTTSDRYDPEMDHQNDCIFLGESPYTLHFCSKSEVGNIYHHSMFAGQSKFRFHGNYESEGPLLLNLRSSKILHTG